jgi:hypothetical protein
LERALHCLAHVHRNRKSAHRAFLSVDRPVALPVVSALRRGRVTSSAGFALPAVTTPMFDLRGLEDALDGAFV